MKQFQLILSEQAKEDLVEIWLYISVDLPVSADRFIDYIYEKCGLLIESPEIGVKREELIPGIRCLSVQRYLIFYRITEHNVEIVRVLSAYRDIESVF